MDRPVSADARYGLSSNFKSTSRQQKAAWGNRFIRDHHDLVYEADIHSISNKIRSIKSANKRAENEQEDFIAKKYQYSPPKAKQSASSQNNLKKGLKVQQYIASVQSMQKTKRTHQSTAPNSSRKTRFHQQNIQIQPFNPNEHNNKNMSKSSHIQQINQQDIKQSEKPVNLLGLSRFQFASTIQGQLIKSNHHLDFNRNKTNKIDNINKVWYDNSKDISPKPKKDKIRQVERIHQFENYSPHQLFHRTKKMLEDNGSGNGGMLDKFYQVTSPQKYNVTHKRTLTGSPNYRCMSARPDIPKKLGTNLEYKIQKLKTLQVGNSKKPVMHMSSSARKLVFNRQVINPSRGCYR